MSPLEFINKIISIYQDARVSRYVDTKISRGRSHSISSITEDLFASYLIQNDPQIEQILVDQPIFIDSTINTFYPDIAVIKKGKVVALFDLKMDLGWNRNGLAELCVKDYNLVQNIKGKTCTIKDGASKERFAYPISKKLIYDIVIITDQNISPITLQKHLIDIEPYKKQVRVHILSTGEHPNTYGLTTDELMAKISVNERSFTDILRRI